MKICRNCGVVQPLTEFSLNRGKSIGRQARCKLCCQVAAKLYRSLNKETVAVSKARYHLEHREQLLKAKVAYQAGTKEKTKARSAAYRVSRKAQIADSKAKHYQLNKERILKTIAQYRNRHREESSKSSKEWVKKNPEAKKRYRNNRRVRETTGGRLSKGIVESLFASQGGNCPCCNEPLGLDFHLDHRMPLALGGLNTDSNMQLLRATCNRQKGMKHPVAFMRSRGHLDYQLPDHYGYAA